MRAPTMVPQGELIPKEDESYNHAARTCRVGPDNKLYITLGQRLWRDQGKVQQACELLAPVLRMVHGGFDTRDLKEAKALMEALGA